MKLYLHQLVLVGLALAQPLGAQDIQAIPQPDGPRVRQGFETLYDRQAIEQDDWETEEAAEVVRQRLYAWSKALGASPADLATPAGDCLDCMVQPLLPPTRPVYQTERLAVGRAGRRALALVEATRQRGPEALSENLAQLVAALPAGERRIAFKIYRLEPHPDGAIALVRYSGFGQGDGRAIEQHSTWRMRWSLQGSPRLLELEVLDHQESSRRGPSLLVDATASILGPNDSWENQLRYPLHHWWRYLDRMSGITFRGYQGLSVGDVDNDGLDDLFVAQPGGLPDRLFLQQLDGTALDVSADARIDYLELTRSALLVDLDNDGDQDLVTVRAAHIVILANDGSGRFDPAAVLPLEGGVAVTAADFDSDGDLDLYGLGYRNPDEGLPPTPYYDASNGQRNHLYRNEGELRFTDVTNEAGMGGDNRRFSFAAVWEDYDNDGDQDLYVANDFGRNNLYRNTDGHFEDVAAAAGVEDISAGMGATWADFDLDGWMDLYVSNMFSSAGGRVTYQRRFRSGDEATTRDLYRRHAKGNSLFRNRGDGTFVDISNDADVTMGRWAWGSLFVDLDNNGHPDIFVPNGFLTNDQTDDL